MMYMSAKGDYISLWRSHLDTSFPNTTPDLHITAGLITVGFVRTGGDVPSLSVMSLKNKKMIGAGLKPTVKDHITIGFWLEPAVFWRALITTGLSQEPTVIENYHCRF